MILPEIRGGGSNYIFIEDNGLQTFWWTLLDFWYYIYRRRSIMKIIIATLLSALLLAAPTNGVAADVPSAASIHIIIKSSWRKWLQLSVISILSLGKAQIIKITTAQPEQTKHTFLKEVVMKRHYIIRRRCWPIISLWIVDYPCN